MSKPGRRDRKASRKPSTEATAVAKLLLTPPPEVQKAFEVIRALGVQVKATEARVEHLAKLVDSIPKPRISKHDWESIGGKGSVSYHWCLHCGALWSGASQSNNARYYVPGVLTPFYQEPLCSSRVTP